nr:PREDICTED: myrosinase-binding protein 1-like isoform X2 [Daucus carota subsp. sativus]
MIRIGPAYPGRGIPWDHKGKTEVAQILISCNRNRINFMYFVYVEDGGTKLVLSEKIGREETSHSMETVNFDYPSEYITRVSGQYNDYLGKYLRFILTKASMDHSHLVLQVLLLKVLCRSTSIIRWQKLANQPGEIAVGGSDGLEASGETS